MAGSLVDFIEQHVFFSKIFEEYDWRYLHAKNKKKTSVYVLVAIQGGLRYANVTFNFTLKRLTFFNV